MIRCANGHENADGAQVCAECGAPLGAEPEAESSGGSFWARQEARSGGAPAEPAPAPVAPAPAPPPPPPPAPEATAASPVLAAPAADGEWDVSVPEPTDAGAPPPVAAASSTGGASDIADRGGVIAVVGAAILIFASFLPWSRATGSLFYVTKDGIDTDAGVIMLLLAVLIALVAAFTLLRPPPSRVGAVLVLIGGMAGVGLSVYEMFQVDDAFDDVLDQVPSRLGIEARVGVGLHLALLASAVIVLGAVFAFVQGHRAQRSD